MSEPKHWPTADVLMMICPLEKSSLAFLKDHPTLAFDSLMLLIEQRRDLAHEVLRLRTEVDILRAYIASRQALKETSDE